MDQSKGTMSVMDGRIVIGQVQATMEAQEESTFAEVADRDSGDEQMNVATEGSADGASKDKSNTAESGKTSGSTKARKRTKTGCLSKPHVSSTKSLTILIGDSMSQTKDKVRRRTTDLQQLCQVQTQLRGIYAASHLQGSPGLISSQQCRPSRTHRAFPFDESRGKC